MNFARASLAPVGSALAAGLMLVTLAVAASSGQQASVAGYGLGVSVAAVVGALVAGGTTLAYAAGSLEEQRAVRRLRALILTPISISTVIAAAAIVSSHSELNFLTITSGGISAIAVNLSEIEQAYLRSRLRIPIIVTTDLASRAAALGLVVIGMDFSIAVFTTMVTRLAALATAARQDPARRNIDGNNNASKVSISKPLYIGNAAQILTDRAIFIVAPITLTAGTAGMLATAMMAVQAISAVATSGFQVTLSQRSQRGPAPWQIAFDMAIAAAALVAAATLALLYFQIDDLLGLQDLSYLVWLLVCGGLPLAVLSRMLLFRLLAAGERDRMATAQAAAAIVATLYFAAIMVIGPSAEYAAAAYILTEGSALALALLLFRRVRK